MTELRFDGRAAIVTGAGRNLGRAYALLLASRGAKVVVNDLGVGISDTDGDVPAPATNPADDVVAEIRAAGGEAEMNGDSIADDAGAARIVRTALDAWGRVDIVINNAGVVRQAPVEDMEPHLTQAMLDTHIAGTMNVTRHAWRAMRAAGYGRILHVSSGAAIPGIAGMSVYSAVKLAVVGLTRSHSLEGAPHGIKVNVIAPYASVRGNDFGPIPWSPRLADWLSPEQVAPLAAFLVHEDCPVTGEWFTVGGGYVGRVALALNEGYSGRPLSPESLRDRWADVMGDDAAFHVSPPGSTGEIRRMMEGFTP
jgi:NAD(P)-dependent dehydrogenase (short-subunit alcohol dehydrogenase family)